MALRKQLTTPYQITFTVTAVKVNSIAVDAENNLIHLGYSLLASDGSVVQSDKLETLSDQAYTNYNTRKNELGETFSATDAASYVALEYLPGNGQIVGDIKELDTPYNVDDLCNVLKIESFAYNTDDGIVLIGYTKMKYPANKLISHLPWALTGQEYTDFMNQLNANEASGMAVTTAEVTTCLEWLPDEGTVVDV